MKSHSRTAIHLPIFLLARVSPLGGFSFPRPFVEFGASPFHFFFFPVSGRGFFLIPTPSSPSRPCSTVHFFLLFEVARFSSEATHLRFQGELVMIFIPVESKIMQGPPVQDLRGRPSRRRPLLSPRDDQICGIMNSGSRESVGSLHAPFCC